MAVNVDKFLVVHLIYPLCALTILSMFILGFDIDAFIADYWYGVQGGTWAWKDRWLAEEFFHKGGRNTSLIFALATLMLLLISCFQTRWIQHRKPLLYLFLATAGGSLFVSLLKSSLAVSCPWEFKMYGGNLVYHTVLEQLTLRDGKGCFPAGHASSGYAWISLYFFGFLYKSTFRWAGLSISLIAGIVLGVAQQIRGAHFISHDVWTLAVCWFFSLFLFLVMFNKRQLINS